MHTLPTPRPQNAAICAGLDGFICETNQSSLLEVAYVCKVSVPPALVQSCSGLASR